MKNKIFYMLMLLSGSAALWSCSSTEKKHDHETAEAHNHDHAHIYACPMHPEVRGKEGDMCPKCGMPLEHMDELESSGRFKMEFFMLDTPQVGRAAGMAFKPVNLDKPGEAIPLDVEHEKKMHVIIVNSDLSWFDHVHPEYRSDGSYILAEAFPAKGDYIIFADYKPSSGSHQLEKINYNVEGVKTPLSKHVETKSLVYTKGDLKLELVGAENITAGKEINIHAALSDKGQKVDAGSLENYLGAKAHMVVISRQDKNYMHVHPGTDNGDFALHTTFDKADTYRAWIQFMYKGVLYTADFTIPVAEVKSTK